MPTRFNPPPNWPPAPPGWTPPPGWQPDPAWPAPPQGWPLWVEDAPAQGPMAQGPMAQRPMGQWPMEQGPMAQGPGMQGPGMQGPGMQGPGMQGPGMQGPGMQSTAVQGLAMRGPFISADSRWTLGGGAAVVIGALVPWVSATVTESGLGVGGLSYEISGGARTASAILGVILIGLGLAMQSKSARGVFVKPKAYAYGVPFIVLSALGLLGYGLFMAAGIAGFTEDDGLGGTAKVTFSPSVGLILLLVGCLVALIGGIKAMRHASPRIR